MSDLTQYINFYGKDPFRLNEHYRTKRISEYMSGVCMDPAPVHGGFCAYRCLNDANAFARLIREHEKNDLIVGEGEITTFPARKALGVFKKYCAQNLEPELAELTPAQIEINGKREGTRIVDAADERYADKNSPVAKVWFTFPFYRNDEKLEKFIGGLADSMYVCGYSYASMHEYGVAVQPFKKPLIIVSVLFEAKFYEEPFAWSDRLYHVTDLRKLGKIRRNGLVPASRSDRFDYPDRVYLFNNADMRTIFDYIETKAAAAGLDKAVVLKIDGRALRSSVPFKTGKNRFYVDHMFEDGTGPVKANAVFTYGNVRPDLIDDEILVVELADGRVAKAYPASMNSGALPPVRACAADVRRQEELCKTALRPGGRAGPQTV